MTDCNLVCFYETPSTLVPGWNIVLHLEITLLLSKNDGIMTMRLSTTVAYNVHIVSGWRTERHLPQVWGHVWNLAEQRNRNTRTRVLGDVVIKVNNSRVHRISSHHRSFQPFSNTLHWGSALGNVLLSIQHRRLACHNIRLDQSCESNNVQARLTATLLSLDAEGVGCGLLNWNSGSCMACPVQSHSQLPIHCFS